MTIASVAVMVAFSVAFACIWACRRMQLRHLHQQAHYLRLLSRQVVAFRQRSDIPVGIADFVEELVRDPLDGGVIRYAIWHASRRDHPTRNVDKEVLAFRNSVADLNGDAQAALHNIVITYIKAQSHADMIAGYIFRRVRFANLERETQAEVAVDTIAFGRSLAPSMA